MKLLLCLLIGLSGCCCCFENRNTINNADSAEVVKIFGNREKEKKKP